MNPDQIVALLQILADLRLQLGELAEENAQLRLALATAASPSED